MPMLLFSDYDLDLEVIGNDTSDDIYKCIAQVTNNSRDALTLREAAYSRDIVAASYEIDGFYEAADSRYTKPIRL